MTASYFVDSNVIVYARDVADRDKQKRATDWIEALGMTGAGRLSYQVMMEAYAALTRSKMSRMDPVSARTYIINFGYWRPIVLDSRVIESAWLIQDRFGFNWWDCLIVAAARVAKCDYLLTEDLQAEQDLDGLVVVNPFETVPDLIQ